jgi:cyclophilin family peptidyl-prolyl cis-trans isomerase
MKNILPIALVMVLFSSCAKKVLCVEITTGFGTMTAVLHDQTPKHKENFLKLSQAGYYDSLLFHRVINGFMIQGGDPNSRNAKPKEQLGMGGPTYKIPAEFVDSLVHIRGALAAARTNNPTKESSGSQFYIVHGKPLTESEIGNMERSKNIKYTAEQRNVLLTQGGVPFLDKEYTVFGQVVEGLDVLDKIASTPTQPGDRPVADVRMTVKVVKKVIKKAGKKKA